MQRLLPAFAAALLIHAALLTTDTRWLIHLDPVAPRTRVVTMQLVNRVPIVQASIHALPAAPPALPPVPQKPSVKPAPVKQPSNAIKKKTPPTSNPIPPSAEPSPLPADHHPEPAPTTPLPTAAIEPVASQPSPAPVEPLSPPAFQVSQQAMGAVDAAPAAIVMATPRYSDNPVPAYPSIARKRKYQGTVILEVFVEADGRVGDLRIVESSTHTLLDRAAMQAVKAWQFEPGRRGDLTVAMWVRVPVQFALN